MRIVRRSVRSALAELVFVALLGATAFAQTTPAPKPTATPRVPKVPLHAEVFVDTNKLGQVTRIESIKPSHDRGFNTQIYGNAAQAFIRKPDGSAIAGLYRLTYDYDPKTKQVHRSADLVRAGGVDANAPGIVTMEQQKLNEAAAHQRSQAAPPAKLPDFNTIVHPSPGAKP